MQVTFDRCLGGNPKAIGFYKKNEFAAFDKYIFK